MISAEDTRELIGLARELFGSRVVALLAYGSQVAGYAAEDSDYDLLAVVDGQREKSRYYYVGTRGLRASILGVTPSAFLGDAAGAELGEFVAGRLLNVYHVLLDGSGMIDEADLTYRRRVVLEEIEELFFNYGMFANELLINTAYFLFSKLKKRASIYPPARYSYISTYTGPMGERNLEWTIERFERVLEKLALDGVVSRAGAGLYRIMISPGRGWYNPALLLVRRAVKQYAAHISSGKVGPRVFFWELLSKMRRAGGRGKRLDYLDRPEGLLAIPEGILSFSKLEPLFGKGCRHTARRLGEFYSAVRLLTAECGEGEESNYIVKDYMSPWSIKWIVVKVIGAGLRTFYLTPGERMSAEYVFTRLLRRKGFRSPRILLVDPRNYVMAREYIGGRTLESLMGSEEGFEDFGVLLGELHERHDITLGDMKPSNFLFKDGEIYFLDCEQAASGGDRAWDVASFMYFLVILGRWRRTEDIERSIWAFLRGYLRAGSPGTVRRSIEPWMAAPFRPLLQPSDVRTVVNSVSDLLTSTSPGSL